MGRTFRHITKSHQSIRGVQLTSFECCDSALVSVDQTLCSVAIVFLVAVVEDRLHWLHFGSRHVSVPSIFQQECWAFPPGMLGFSTSPHSFATARSKCIWVFLAIRAPLQLACAFCFPLQPSKTQKKALVRNTSVHFAEPPAPFLQHAVPSQ